MFELSGGPPAERTSVALQHVREELAALDVSSGTEADRVELLTELEKLKAAAAALQARLAASLADSRVEASGHTRGLASEVALARQESPHKGSQLLGLGTALVQEMPHTLAALQTGLINEWRASILVRETQVLTREDRMAVDREMAGTLAGMGDRKLAARARSIGYRLDPGSVLRRVRGAVSDRNVSIRPAPDTMTYVTAFLPVAAGVACHAALLAAADAAQASGDERTRGQVMADTLVARVTGQDPATPADVQINVVMTDRALLGAEDTSSHEAAHVPGYGPVPAFLARQLVRAADKAWVRRLFTSPGTGELVAMDSTRRLFEGPLRRFLVLRDDVCRTPWCDAPIRHLDHIERHAAGGPTDADNAQGLCVTCNLTKEAAGWTVCRTPGGRHRVTTTTPTGHAHTSQPTLPPGSRPPRPITGEVYRSSVVVEYVIGA